MAQIAQAGATVSCRLAPVRRRRAVETQDKDWVGGITCPVSRATKIYQLAANLLDMLQYLSQWRTARNCISTLDRTLRSLSFSVVVPASAMSHFSWRVQPQQGGFRKQALYPRQAALPPWRVAASDRLYQQRFLAPLPLAAGLKTRYWFCSFLVLVVSDGMVSSPFSLCLPFSREKKNSL